MRRRKHRARRCLSGRCRTPCPPPRCGRFRSATSASAVEKRSPARACCCLRATQTTKLDGLLVMDLRQRRQPRLLPHLLRRREPAGTGRGRDERPAHARSSRPRLSKIYGRWSARRPEHRGYLSLSSPAGRKRASPAIETALRRINYMAERLVDEPLRPPFQDGFAAPCVRCWTGLDGRRAGEPEDIQSLRSTVIFTLGNAGHDPDVLREARRLAQLHVSGATRLHASIADVTLQLAAIEGDAALYDQYLARMGGRATSESLQYLARCPSLPTRNW